MRDDKVFKTIDEQIDIMISKGITINNVDKAKQILLRENYFFLNGYRRIFIDSTTGKYYPGTTFEEIHSMFLFDRALRNIFFKWILVIENNFKSIMSYSLSKKYGYKDNDYLTPKNFTQDSMKQRQVRDVLKKAERQIRVNGSEHAATQHYKQNYGYIPLWVVVKVLSFGIMVEFYSILKSEDRADIASVYGIVPSNLETYLSLIANYRNICAHEEVLYDHKTQKEMPNVRYYKELNIPMEDGEYIYGRNDLFALIIILKELTTQDEFKSIVKEIKYEEDILAGKVNSVDIKTIMNKCGFPDNWEDIVIL